LGGTVKIRSAVACLVAAGVTLGATALPATAATTTVTVPDATRGVSVDAGTGRVYVGTQPSPPPDIDPFHEWVSSAGVAQVDVRTKRVVNSVTLFTSMSSAIGFSVSDVEVSSTSNDLWVVVGSVSLAYQCGGTLYQLDKRSLATIRTYDVGCARRVELDPTSRSVYLVAGPPEFLFGNDSAQPANLVAVNGATGDVRRAVVPAQTAAGDSSGDLYRPSSLAFDPRNDRLYLVGAGNTLWVYTKELVPARTVTLGYPTSSPLSVVADPAKNRVYVTDGATLTEISAQKERVARTAQLAGSGIVIDPRANLLYLGTNTVKFSTLRSIGQQPRPVQAVDPSTHARFFVAPGLLYIDQ